MGKSYVILLGLSLIVSLAFVIVAATMTIITSMSGSKQFIIN